MKIVKKMIAGGLMLAPGLAFAANVTTIINSTLKPILNAIVPLLIAVAVVLFLYGVVKYILSGDDEEARGKAKNFIIYGVIGLFVMVSIWGLVSILADTFGLSNSVTVPTNALP